MKKNRSSITTILFITVTFLGGWYLIHKFLPKPAQKINIVKKYRHIPKKKIFDSRPLEIKAEMENEIKKFPLTKKTAKNLKYRKRIVNKMQSQFPKGTKVNLEYLQSFEAPLRGKKVKRDLVLLSTTFPSGEFRSFKASIDPETGKIVRAYGSTTHTKPIAFQMDTPDTED